MSPTNPIEIEGKSLNALNASERRDLITALHDEAASAASDLQAFAVTLKDENYESALTSLDAAKGKLVKIDDLFGEFVHHHRRGKI